MSRIFGKIFNQNSEQYLLVYSSLNTAYKVLCIEEEPIKGYRIVQIIYRYYVENQQFIGDRLFTDVRYGLLDSNNNLATQCDFFSLVRMEDGRINAVYPDPKYGGNKSYHHNEERFNCILNFSGKPLFKYITKDSDGNKIIKYKELDNEITAVSKCYYGIALFVKNHKIGIVDFNGDIKLDAEYTHIELRKYYNCFNTYKVDVSRFIQPRDWEDKADIYVLNKDKSNWPIKFVKLNSGYYIKEYYEKEDMYLLKNKQTDHYCICFKNGIRKRLCFSKEYIWLERINSNNWNNCYFIATSETSKKGIAGIIEDKESIFNVKKETLVCPFEYDTIAQYNGHFLIIAKNSQKGVFSLDSMSIIVNCIIPGTDMALPDTIGEGLIGCYRKNKSNTSKEDRIYYFSDLDGHKVLVLDTKWEIKSKFENGVAKIESKNEYAFINLKGEIIESKEKDKTSYYKSDCYEDDIDRDNWDAMTDGMYGDYPEEGFDGDYETIGF